jgi:hypothetical protein
MGEEPTIRSVIRSLVVIATCLAGIASAASARGDEPPAAALADKSGYSLFNPTPPGLLRELAADRPDVTENPRTIDAGHVQVELSFAAWGKGSGVEDVAVLPFNFKLGLTNYADIQFVYGPYIRQLSPGRVDEGHGDTLIRLKINLWGNDGGHSGTALAIMPFISIPTGADAFTADAAEGGIIVPFQMPLPADFDLTLMAELDFIRDGAGGRDTLLVHTASLGHDLIGDLAGYIEYVGAVDLDGDQKYQASFGVGFTFGVNENVQLDCGANVGLNAAAQDLQIFAGMTFRI